MAADKGIVTCPTCLGTVFTISLLDYNGVDVYQLNCQKCRKEALYISCVGSRTTTQPSLFAAVPQADGCGE